MPTQVDMYFYIKGPDLSKRWTGRIQSKVKDAASQESYMKLSSLIDYFNKPAAPHKEVKLSPNVEYRLGILEGQRENRRSCRKDQREV